MPARYCIVGGVAGGASAATRLRRLDEEAEIVLFERGPYVSFANCGLPYHIGGQISERDALLVATPELLASRAGLDVRVNTEVVAIDAATKTITYRARSAGADATMTYDALILSPGAGPLRPPIPGIEHPRIRSLRNIPDMDAIIEIIDRDHARSALVIGGGYIGLEMAEALRDRRLATTLVELAPQVMGPADPEMAAMLHQELSLNGIDLILGQSVDAFTDANGAVTATLSGGETVTADLVILAIGVKPEAELAKAAGLAIGERGGISVDAQMRTSDSHIYAVGDAVEVRDLVSETMALIPLAGPANRQGRIAADTICGRTSSYQATQGTAVCKVFNQNIAMTGMSEKLAKRLGRRVATVYVHPLDHAGYYPGATNMCLKLIYDPDNERVLGAQAVGPGDVDKRIDVIAMAVRHGLTVRDLAEAELCYAPPFGSAKDPVNYAGFAACNIIDGLVTPIHAAAVADWEGHILDVSTAAEFTAGHLGGAINIPVDELRGRIAEVPRDKPVLVYCAAGLRGYVACRMLSAAGIDCRNLVGGLKVHKLVHSDPSRFHRPPAGAEAMGDDPEPDPPASTTVSTAEEAIVIDACGLQCPGPIMQLKNAIDQATVGQVVRISATDPGFAGDVEPWCAGTGNDLVALEPRQGGGITASIRKCEPGTDLHRPSPVDDMTIVAFSGDWDKAMATFIIANGALSMGLKPTIFFTFWGINALRRDNPPAVQKTLIERMFGWMMPRGARKLALSKMHFAGMGRKLMDNIMKQKNVEDLPSLIAAAQRGGVRLVACAMSMDLMGIKAEELIDGVEMGGVASYLGAASHGRVNLFI